MQRRSWHRLPNHVWYLEKRTPSSQRLFSHKSVAGVGALAAFERAPGGGALVDVAVADVAEEVMIEDKTPADSFEEAICIVGITGKRARDSLRKKRAKLCEVECQCGDETVTNDMGDWRQLHDGVGYSWRFTPD